VHKLGSNCFKGFQRVAHKTSKKLSLYKSNQSLVNHEMIGAARCTKTNRQWQSLGALLGMHRNAEHHH